MMHAGIFINKEDGCSVELKQAAGTSWIEARDDKRNFVNLFVSPAIADRIRPHVEAINDAITCRDPLDDLAALAYAPSIATTPQPEPVDDLDDGNITE